jgi:AcrR family transcriptional regulator
MLRSAADLGQRLQLFVEAGAMSGKPGRPPEDRLRRQHEIFLAVAPLIERYGAKRLTMRQAARAAHLSLGGLYHYFPTKRDLVLHALKPEAVARLCAEFHGRHAGLERTDPGRHVQADVDYMARQCFFIRPAFHAALELDAEVAWDHIRGWPPTVREEERPERLRVMALTRHAARAR